MLITEKLPKLINRPSLIARQVDEGGAQIGATNEEVGLDDGVTTAGLAGLAARAVAAYPPCAAALALVDDTFICRCEEVAAGEIRADAKLGCLGPIRPGRSAAPGWGAAGGAIAA